MAGKRVLFERRTEPRSQVSRKGELLADVTGAPGRNYVTGALGINVTASNRVYWRSKPFTGTFPVTGSVNLPVILQCSVICVSSSRAKGKEYIYHINFSPSDRRPTDHRAQRGEENFGVARRSVGNPLFRRRVRSLFPYFGK